MYSFCWTPVALKNAIVTSQITYSSFMPQHCICIICYTWWISKNIHKNFYTSSEKEEHRPWSSSCEKKRKKSTKIHQNLLQLLLLINLQEKNRHLDVGLQERGSKRLGSGLHLGVAWHPPTLSCGEFGGKIFDPNATDNTSNIVIYI